MTEQMTVTQLAGASITIRGVYVQFPNHILPSLKIFNLVPNFFFPIN